MYRKLAGENYIKYFKYKSKKVSLILGKPCDKVFNFNMKNVSISPQGLVNNLYKYNNLYYKKDELIDMYPHLCGEIVSYDNISAKEKSLWLHRYNKFEKMDKKQIPDLVKVHTLNNNTGLAGKFFSFIVGTASLFTVGILGKICVMPIQCDDLTGLLGCAGVSICATIGIVCTDPSYIDKDGLVLDQEYIKAVKNSKFDKESNDLGYLFEQAINRIENNDKYVKLTKETKELNDMTEEEIENMLKKSIKINK